MPPDVKNGEPAVIGVHALARRGEDLSIGGAAELAASKAAPEPLAIPLPDDHPAPVG
jgi:hypothetical protein